MQSIDRALLHQVASGRRIEFPWESVNRLVTLNTRELAMLAGAPGSGKSTLAIALAVRTDATCLYLTQDSPASVFQRMAALYTDMPIQAVRKALQAGGADEKAIVEKVLRRRRSELVVEHGRMTPGDIDRRIVALTEWLGEPPKLVVVDNLIDMNIEQGTKSIHHQETGFYAVALTALKEMANRRGVAILALHHVLKSGDKGDGTHPITMTDMLHGGEREARHVWGVYHDEDNARLWLQILKQQDGPAKPGGQLKVPLTWVPETGQVLNLGR